VDMGGGKGTDGGGGAEGGGGGVGDVDDLEGETALATGCSSTAYYGSYCIVGYREEKNHIHAWLDPSTAVQSCVVCTSYNSANPII